MCESWDVDRRMEFSHQRNRWPAGQVIRNLPKPLDGPRLEAQVTL